ncbi:MAG: DUF1538 domain-containing protein [Pseudomonadota bacterium]
MAVSSDKSSIAFSELIRELTYERHTISLNKLVSGAREAPGRIALRTLDRLRLVRHYLDVRLSEQLRAVIPLAAYLIGFQVLILKQQVEGPHTVFAGLIAVVLGLMVFLEGLKVGLMPFGETIGHTLPRRARLPTVLIIALLLGIGVTFAEPAIGALKAAGRIVDGDKAPYLYALLNQYADLLVLVVGAGVGLAAVLGTLRFLNGWSLKPLVYVTLVPTLGLTLYAASDPRLVSIIGLAWDCGAVTTGPVTVPLVLSLGIGIAAAAGKGDNPLSGFGIVTLASLFPIIGVLGLGIFLVMTEPLGGTLGAATIASTVENAPMATAPVWYESSPGVELITSLRAIVPLVLFLFLVFRVMLRSRLSQSGTIAYGIGLSVLGMWMFNIGLSYGLSRLGDQTGWFMPAAFMRLDHVLESPLFLYGFGLLVALAFAWVLGFGATLAEPALNALGNTVQNLTNGVFKKKALMYAVSTGVGVGIAIGLVKIIFEVPLAYLLIPLYLVAVVLTFFSTEEYVNIAWDSAGVTTGPITVPLVLAIGLGFGNAVDAVEGFGILSMASICPIISVLATGIWVRLWECTRSEDEPCQFAIPASAETSS